MENAVSFEEGLLPGATSFNAGDFVSIFVSEEVDKKEVRRYLDKLKAAFGDRVRWVESTKRRIAFAKELNAVRVERQIARKGGGPIIYIHYVRTRLNQVEWAATWAFEFNVNILGQGGFVVRPIKNPDKNIWVKDMPLLQIVPPNEE